MCKARSPSADLVLRLLASIQCGHLCITPTLFGTIATLANLTFDRYNEKTVGGGSRLGIFGQKRQSGVCVSNARVATALGDQHSVKQAIRRKKLYFVADVYTVERFYITCESLVRINEKLVRKNMGNIQHFRGSRK